ncbi:MAG: MFS transporter, partial [Planctomycetota bacterium]
CIATALLAFPPEAKESVTILVVLFIVANFSYQLALVFYDALLPVVASEKRTGFVSGLGVGLGYAGIIFSFFILNRLETAYGICAVFVGAGVLFALFAIPLFLFVPDRRFNSTVKFNINLIKNSWRELRITEKEVRSNKRVLYFFIGNFLIVDAVNTAIVFFGVYIVNVFNYSVKQLIPVLVGLYTVAFISGIIIGKLCDKYGSKKLYVISSFSFITAILLCACFRNAAVTFGAVILFGGFALSGVWTAGRKFLLDLAPKEKIGEYFGLYGLTGKLSAFGTIFFALIADYYGYRAALVSLLATSISGLIVIILSKEVPSVAEEN